MFKTWKTRNGYIIIRILGGRSNVFHVMAEGRSILFDTSTNLQRKRLIENLKQIGIDHIDYLVISHVHFDHVGNAAYLKREFEAKVVVHSDESEDLRLARSRIPRGTNRITKFLIKTFSDYAEKRYSFVKCEPDIVVKKETDFRPEDISIHLLFTPGHTSGSMSLIVDNEIALVGDTLFHVFPGAVYPPFANDEKKLLTSWEKLIKTDCSFFLPAHGREISRKLFEKCFNRLHKNTRK